MNTHDHVRRELLLLAGLLQGDRRRRPALAAMCLALQVLLAARDVNGALADLGAYFVRCAHAARGTGDLESAAAFEMAADVTRIHGGADVARRRARMPRSTELGTAG